MSFRAAASATSAALLPLLLVLACRTTPVPSPAVARQQSPVSNVTVQGTITDETTALPGVTVSLRCNTMQGSRTTVTDFNGSYRFDSVPAGKCLMRAALSGFTAATRTFDAKPGASNTVNAALHITSVAEMITVTAASPSQAIAVLQSAAAERANGAEEYSPSGENHFISTAKRAMSTFASDVDTASYTNIRRMLQQHTLPPTDAVRIEEMVNYFRYDDAAPRGSDPFSVTTELANCPWRADHALLRIGVKSRAIDVSTAPPHNIVFLIDVSGSMDEPKKLPLVKTACDLLVDELRGQDRVAIVVYAGREALLLPSTPGSDKATIRKAIDDLQAEGSTAGEAGIRLAYKIANENFLKGGNNRVILATDGDFNVGVSSDAELEQLIVSERDNGIFLTTLGYGSGNLKDGKLELLADKGNGNYYYIDSEKEARRVMVEQLGGTFVTLAKDVKLQVVFDPATVTRYRLIGYENRILKAQDFDDDTKDAGDVGSGQSVTALYELELSREVPPHLADIRIRYKQPNGNQSALLQFPVTTEKKVIENCSNDMRMSAAVAELGLLLRKSQFASNANYAQVLALARSAIGPDLDGTRSEFLQLTTEAQSLDKATPVQAARKE